MTRDALRRRLSPLLTGALLAGGLMATPAAAQEVDLGDRLLLDVGHTDAFEVSLADDDLLMSMKDDTFLHTDQIVYRDPSEVVFQIKPEALTAVPPGEAWSFLGAEGDPIHLLPQTQDPNLLWPGWSTERMTSSAFDGPIELSLRELQGPGDLKLFMTSAIGQPILLADSEDGLPDAWNVNVPQHVHANWVFTAPGTYLLTVEASGTAANGTALSTGEVEYVWHVGDIADYEDPTATDPIETTLTIEGLAHHYHTGDTIDLTAVQDPQTDLDHYHWYTRSDDTQDWQVVPGALTDSLQLTAGEDPALDGADVVARLFDDEHEVVAESDPVTIAIDDHDDHDDPIETTLTIEGLAHHYHTGDTANLTAVQDPQTDLDHYHWFVTAAGGEQEVVPGEATDTYSFTVTAEWDGAEVVARLYDDEHEVVAESDPVTILVDDHDDHDDPPEFPFTDVTASNVHFDPIRELWLGGITIGTTATTYSPAASVSRGQLATFVARMLELPDAPADYPDVSPGHVHAGAIGAVTEAGFFEGFGNGEFGSAEPVSREQIATVVARALGLEGHDDDRFGDIAGSSHRQLINALADVGVTFGVDGDDFDPQADLRRDQMASFLVRALAEAEG